jgi:glycosyltransferase involved in cell wall biosynthesis
MSFQHLIVVEPYGGHAGVVPVRARVLAQQVPKVTLISPEGTEFPELLGKVCEQSTVKNGSIPARVSWSLGQILQRSAKIRFLPGRLVRSLCTGAEILRVAAAMLQARSLQKRTNGETALLLTSNYIGFPTEFALLAGRRMPQIHVLHFPESALKFDLPAFFRRFRPTFMPVALAVSLPSGLEKSLAARFPHLTIRVLPQAGIGERSPGPCRAEAREHLAIPADRYVVLLFGQWHGSKDNLTALQAIGRVLDLWLLVAGDPLDHDVPALCDRYSIDPCRRTLSLHHIDPNDVAKYYAASDAVLVSHRATFTGDSGVLADAISYRRPVIATAQTYAGLHVRQAGLGSVFEAGEVESLITAFERVRKYPPATSVFENSGIASVEQAMKANLQLLTDLQARRNTDQRRADR